MADLKLGNIKPVGADNVVVDGKYVKGGFVVVSSTTERDALKGSSGENIVTGSLCYCTANSKFYQYNGTSWEESGINHEAFLTWGGKNFAGEYGPLDASMIPDLGANRLAFFKKDYIVLESSTDGGSTWTTVNNDSIKAGLFSTGTSFYIGNNSTSAIKKSNYMCRVTITTSNAACYSALNKFAISCSTSGSTGCYCTIDARTKANQDAGADTWVNFANEVSLSGWSGWNIINTSTITTHGNNTSQYSQIRFTFGVTSHAATVAYPGLTIQRIMAFGGMGWTTPSNMAKNGHLYAFDASQNATFPANITATGTITEGGALLSDKYAPKSHTHATTIAASTSTNELTLAYGGKYAITAGGDSFIFTMPASDNTNTAHSHEAGTGITLTDDGGTSGTTKISVKKSDLFSVSGSTLTVYV